MRDHERLVLALARGAQADEQVHAPGLDVLLGVDALVAHDVEGIACRTFAEQARRGERLQERTHLPLELAPHRGVAGFEHRPTGAPLDAAFDQQGPAPRGEQRAVDTVARPSRQRLQRQRVRRGRAQRLQRIHAVRRELEALQLGEHARRPRPGTQQQLVVRPALPRRALLVHARECSGDRTAVGEGLVPSAQAVIGEDARKAHQRVLAAEGEFVQAAHHVVAALPRCGRIDDQHRAQVPAEARRDHEHARADVAIAGGRRDADEAQVLGRAQREHSRAALGGADEIVIRERSPVVAICARGHVADRVARPRAKRAIGTL